MSQQAPDCSCIEFLKLMGMSWYECMYAVMCKKALEINQELMVSLEENRKLQKHIDLLNKIGDLDGKS